MPWKLVLLVAAIVLFVLYGLEIKPDDATAFLGFGLACFAGSFLPIP